MIMICIILELTVDIIHMHELYGTSAANSFCHVHTCTEVCPPQPLPIHITSNRVYDKRQEFTGVVAYSSTSVIFVVFKFFFSRKILH